MALTRSADGVQVRTCRIVCETAYWLSLAVAEASLAGVTPQGRNLNNNSPPFAERLMALRRRAQLDQSQLAERIGSNPSTVSRMESGASQPTLGTIAALARVLGCTTDYLCGLADHPERLPPQHWLLDVALWERGMAGDQSVRGSTLAVPIPDRVEILTSTEWHSRKERMLAVLDAPPRKKR